MNTRRRTLFTPFRIALVSFGLENLGIEFLAARMRGCGAAIRVFHDQRLFGGNGYCLAPRLERWFDKTAGNVAGIMSWQPHLVGFSVHTIHYRKALAVAAALRRRGLAAPIIFGGIHPTTVPERTLRNPEVDYV
ncbi:cobalamin-dependent protein, partial [bacterium]|nr:cobalamin-dependent protein [candidate division CSSED10-310 bacterium]